MYRLPTYNSLVEGCLTNLYKTVLWVLDNATGKNYLAQTKLNPICEALKANGFDLIVQNVDADIRNAINHGGIVFKKNIYAGDEISFHFSKGNAPYVKTLKTYEIDRLIDVILDDAGGILLGLCDFINNHINEISVDMTKPSLPAFGLSALELSNADIACKQIGVNYDGNQLNVEFSVLNTDREFLHQQAFLLSLMIYEKYTNYEQYYLGFGSPRMMNGWIRFTKQELNDISQKRKSGADVFQQVIKRRDLVIFDASDEEIDLQEVKYYRYPTYRSTEYLVNNIADASLPDRKRLRANMFIGDIDKKEEIIKLIDEAILWLRMVKNPAQKAEKIKHGEMPADSLYINVYRRDNRRNRELLTNNENFVCFVDYNEDAVTTLKNGGILPSVWSKLYHEDMGTIKYAWRESKYYMRRKTNDVGRNDPCPCGSGKKYKKCCIE